jgi:hypothetical protein
MVRAVRRRKSLGLGAMKKCAEKFKPPGALTECIF